MEGWELQCATFSVERFDRMARRGGAAQRVWEAESHGEDHPDSALVERLLELWAWGILSAPLTQWLAEGTVLDGNSRLDVVALASVGKAGTWAGNTRRDLLHRCLRDMDLPEPVQLRIPYIDKDNALGWAVVPIVMPSQLCRGLYHKYPEHFQSLLGGGLQNFLEQVDPQDPKLLGHPMLAKPNWKQCAIPLVLHGDGVMFVKQTGNTLMVLHFSFLLSKGNTWDTHFLITGVPKTCRANADEHGHDTMDFIWGAVARDLHALFHGSKDGVPIFDGDLFGVVWIVCGDLEFLSNELKMLHFNSNNPCWLCDANRSNRNCRAVGPSAPWRATVRTDATAPSDHAIWRIPGLHRHHCPGDAMHVSDCRGCASHMVGSALWQLVLEGPGPLRGSLDHRVSVVWSMIKDLYAELRVENRLGHLTRDMLCLGPQSWACLIVDDGNLNSPTERKSEVVAAPMGMKDACPSLCGRLLEDGSWCQEQCTHPAGHGGHHLFECLHTLPPPPPLRPVPLPEEKRSARASAMG